MRRARRITTLLLIPLAAACAGEEDEADGDGPAAGASAAAESAPASGGEGHATGSSVTLVPRNDSGMSGTAVLRPGSGDTLVVALSLSGLEAGRSYPAHVHEGSCSSPGTPVAGLDAVDAAATTGRSTTRVVDPRVEDPEGPYLVMAHMPDGTPAACGEIPTEREPPAARDDAAGGR